MPKAGSTVRPMATSTIRRRGRWARPSMVPAGQWPAGTLARQGCLHGLRDRVRAGPEFPGAVAGMARRPRAAGLHVLAVEGHPFAPADLAALLARHAPAAGRPGARAGGSMAAAAAWLASARIRRRAVTLTLAFGEAQTVAPRLDACVDAYFLDGFAPGRNPRMGTGAAARTGRHGSAGRDPGHLGLHRRAASGIVRIRFRRAP